MPAPDHRDAAIHAARAERHWSDARRFRALGLDAAARQAIVFAEDEDRIAAMLRETAQNQAVTDPHAEPATQRRLDAWLR